eukprot:SAG11_NODE_5475_length_1550_cov_7.393522_2_plen_149_part_00
MNGSVGELYGEISMGEAMPWEYGEGNYAVRVGLPPHLGGGGLCTARAHFSDACHNAIEEVYAEDDNDDDEADDEEEGVAERTRRRRHRRRRRKNRNQVAERAEKELCHRIFEEQRPKTERELSEYDWFFWGTALHSHNRTTLPTKSSS